jgi:hypothetical protein
MPKDKIDTTVSGLKKLLSKYPDDKELVFFYDADGAYGFLERVDEDKERNEVLIHIS